MIPTLIPAAIPAATDTGSPTPPDVANPTSLYDVAIGGIEFVYANSANTPMLRETVPPEKQRIDQAKNAGEQTLGDWWLKSQQSFHGGAGQLMLEPAFTTPFDEVRYDASKNVDVFVPGRVAPLPDTAVLTSSGADKVLGVVVAGADAVAVLSSGTLTIITSVHGTPSIATITAVTGVVDIATDGTTVYAATATAVWKVNPGSHAGTSMYGYTSDTHSVVGWVKARLMLGTSAGVYELDTAASGATLGVGELRYQSPVVGWVWRAFSASPSAILAAGDALGQSTITQFNVTNVDGAPVLEVQSEIAVMPQGERILSMANSQGTFLAVGSTKGVRVGTFNTYTGALALGPLELQATDPVIPAVSLALRDRFVFAAGYDYDEGGLICVDLGTQVDNAGRFAWSPHLVAPVTTTTAATSVTTLPLTGQLVFSIPGTGVLLEGTTPGTVRQSWIRTSRIRYGTTEPKLFKFGLIRGDLTTGEIRATAINPYTSKQVAIVGFTTSDPDQFRLLDGGAEWLQLRLDLFGADVKLTSYQVKALPGSRRQRHLQFVLSIADSETTRNGTQVHKALSTRSRLAALEAIDASGDETTLQEFTPLGVVSTKVVIETMRFQDDGRPTGRSDLGGVLTVLLRTVES